MCDDGNPLPAQCDQATVTVTVSPQNDPPVANDNTDNTPENIPVITDVLTNDHDNNDPLGNVDPTSITLVTPPSNGTVSINPTTGDITYTPNLNYNGTDTYVYQVCDDGNPLPAACDQATVTLSVGATNNAPIVTDDTDNTTEDTPVITDVLANDDDPNDATGNIDPTTVTIIVPPANGTVSVNPTTGHINYTPNPNFNGTDTYVYEVCDDGAPLPAICEQAVVTITVVPQNDAPTVVDDTETTTEEVPVIVDILNNDHDNNDPSGGIDATSVTIIANPHKWYGQCSSFDRTSDLYTKCGF